MNANDVKKDLYKSKNNAKFSHYVSGNLYYTVDLTTGRFQFPIPVVENVPSFRNSELCIDPPQYFDLQLSEDLGTTPFAAEIKGSDLNRWIAKAIEKDEFIEVKTGGLNLTKLSAQFDEILNNTSTEDVQNWLAQQKVRVDAERKEIDKTWDELENSGLDKPFELRD